MWCVTGALKLRPCVGVAERAQATGLWGGGLSMARSLPVGMEQDSGKVRQASWTLEITAERPRLLTQLRELWRYRDLVMLLVRRDFVAVYKQTILGPLWHLLQPLLTTLVFSVIFGRIAALPTDELPPFLFYLAGNVLWSYFAIVFTTTSTTFVTNAAIFGKVYFPRLALPISVVLSRLIGFGLQLLMLLLTMAIYQLNGGNLRPNGWLAALPLAVLLAGGLGLAGGLLVTALTTRYRDLAVLATFGVQLLLYATPVVYPLSTVPEQYRGWLLLNPLTAPVETFRYALLGAGSVDGAHLAGSMVLTLVLLTLALLVFMRVERRFIDTV